MSKQVRVIILRTAGTNCDRETAFAFEHCGAKVDLIHIDDFHYGRVTLKNYHILALPGGFTYGDDIASGRILANELYLKLGEEIQRFIKARKLVIGICNGFQVLVKSGILPGNGKPFDQTVTLTHNDCGKFEDRWVHLKAEGSSVWTQGFNSIVTFPVAHAEGKFIANTQVLKALNAGGQVAFRYTTVTGRIPTYPDNPNGSCEHIAGITDSTGRVLGLMPHPERHFLFEHHPRWTRRTKRCDYGHGARIFRNGVTYVKQTL